MKKSIYLSILSFFAVILVLPISHSDAANFNYNDPMQAIRQVRDDANKNRVTAIQNTDLDNTTSKGSMCDGIAPDSRFTITRTLCSVKANIKNYLQYVMYIWLTAATIFLIWNGFLIVVSPNREAQMKTFTKNLKYIVVWVVLLTWFYYIIDILIWLVNLFTD